MDAILRLVDLHHRYPGAEDATLRGVELAVFAGDRRALVGPSGSGKSTLLALIALLDHPTAGRVEIGGADAARFTEAQRDAWRRTGVGLVFQDHHLLAHATALENVLLPAWADGRPDAAAHARARLLLDRLGLSDRIHHLPSQLSTGQRQRVAVARALLRSPRLLLADEPTGSLDPARAGELVDLLLAVEPEVAVLLVTHDAAVASRLPLRSTLVDGRLVEATS